MRTSITNTAGVAKYFGWLPPHGALLDDGEEKVIEGDLRTILGGGRGRYSRSRELAGLNDAVTHGLVAEAEAPNPSSSSSSSSSI